MVRRVSPGMHPLAETKKGGTAECNCNFVPCELQSFFAEIGVLA